MSENTIETYYNEEEYKKLGIGNYYTIFQHKNRILRFKIGENGWYALERVRINDNGSSDVASIAFNSVDLLNIMKAIEEDKVI